MPVLRYFAFVGGALLALLFVCNALLPQVSLPETVKSASALPPVRIKSERKWPERVVFDTTIPSGAPVTIAKADTTQQTVGAVGAQKASPRDAFAQMGTEPKQQITRSANGAIKAAAPGALKIADATPPKAAEQRSEARAQVKRRVVAKVHPSRPMIIVAQQPQPHFGFFDLTW
jgi:hypothetical protein